MLWFWIVARGDCTNEVADDGELDGSPIAFGLEKVGVGGICTRRSGDLCPGHVGGGGFIELLTLLAVVSIMTTSTDTVAASIEVLDDETLALRTLRSVGECGGNLSLCGESIDAIGDT
jgi:hypothetical protein